MARVPETPALIYFEDDILANCERYQYLKEHCNLEILYSLKANYFSELIEIIAPFCDGYSLSSMNEFIYARNRLPALKSMAFVSAILDRELISKLQQASVRTTASTISQLRALVASEMDEISLRLAPTSDSAWWPHGLTANSIRFAASEGLLNQRVTGVHIHSQHRQASLREFLERRYQVEPLLDKDFLPHFNRINLGGGLMAPSPEAVRSESSTVNCSPTARLTIEPGNGFFADAGSYVIGVKDIHESSNGSCAITDGSYTHYSFIREMNFVPRIEDEDSSGEFGYHILGRTCSHADSFGYHKFNRRLKPGDRLILKNMGAYGFSRIGYFNGVLPPDVYLFRGNSVKKFKSFDYLDFERFFNKV